MIYKKKHRANIKICMIHQMSEMWHYEYDISNDVIHCSSNTCNIINGYSGSFEGVCQQFLSYMIHSLTYGGAPGASPSINRRRWTAMTSQITCFGTNTHLRHSDIWTEMLCIHAMLHVMHLIDSVHIQYALRLSVAQLPQRNNIWCMTVCMYMHDVMQTWNAITYDCISLCDIYRMY